MNDYKMLATKYHKALRGILVAVDDAKRFDCVDPQFEKNLLQIINGVGITDPRFPLSDSDVLQMPKNTDQGNRHD